MLKTSNRLFSLLVMAVFWLTPATAQKADLEKDMDITSDQQSFDYKNKISVLSGNVRVSQGSLLLLADKLTISRIEGDGSEKLVATGTPATYSQMLDDGKVIEAQASQIEYDVETKELILTLDAKITQAGSSVTGDTLRYNLETELLKAESNSGGRVHTLLKPKAKKDQESTDEDVPSDQPSAESTEEE